MLHPNESAFPMEQESAPSSGYSTPARSTPWTLPKVSSITGLLRRFTAEPLPPSRLTLSPTTSSYVNSNAGMDGSYTPPYRTASPWQPPPLYPIILRGYDPTTAQSAQLLNRTLAEEIRLLVPARLQLCEEWTLIYSLEQNGSSLKTLYEKSDDYRGLRNGFVLVVRDGGGGMFGAYLTEAPHPAPHYFGTGECFLWRSSVLSPMDLYQNLPLPPSADTTNMQRSTTLANSGSLLSPTNSVHGHAPPSPLSPMSTGTSASERIRFKAFPYSGVNDYLMFCETGFLSIGGGDGHYGLWLDDTFEKGISSSCPTFGNEPLSEDGEKFDIIGVELWSIGNSRE